MVTLCEHTLLRQKGLLNSHGGSRLARPFFFSSAAVMAECAQDQPAKWRQTCSERHLLAISQEIAQWRDIAPYLDLTEAEEVEIVGSPPRPVPSQRFTMLRKWRQKFGTKATYEQLARVFRICRRQDLVDRINELLTEDSSSSSDEEGMSVVLQFNET